MDGEGYIRKAYEAIFGGDFELAVACFEEAIALEPANAAYHYKCSITCARSGKWLKAVYYAEEALRLEPQQEEHMLHLQLVKSKLLVHEAEGMLAQNQIDREAITAKLQQAVQLDPLNVEALLLLGASYEAMGQVEDALQAAREAVRLAPEHRAARRLYLDVWKQRRMPRLYGQRIKRIRNR